MDRVAVFLTDWLFYRVWLDGWLVCRLGNWTFLLSFFCKKKTTTEKVSAQIEPPERGILGKVLVRVTYSSPLCISAEQLHLYKYHATLHSRPYLSITVTERSAPAQQTSWKLHQEFGCLASVAALDPQEWPRHHLPFFTPIQADTEK